MSAPAATPDIDGLFVVADGMGGHQAGDVASGYVVGRLHELFSSAAFQQDVHYSTGHADYFAAALKEILERCNEELYTLASSRADLRGMGTTATVALLFGDRLFLGQVGDSRAYLLRDGVLRQLTEDHSWVAEQVRDGKLNPAEAASHPRKNVLTRSLGSSLVVRVDRSIHALQSGDRLLLCSDGLTNHVQSDELQQALTAQGDVQASCDWLVGLANQRGGSDNITVVIAHFGADSIPARLLAQQGFAAGTQPSVVAVATTQKLMRTKARRRLLSPNAARKLRRAALVLLLSLSLAAGVFALLRFGIGKTSIDSLPGDLDQLALIAAATAAVILAIGLILGLLLARRWAEPVQTVGNERLPDMASSAEYRQVQN